MKLLQTRLAVVTLLCGISVDSVAQESIHPSLDETFYIGLGAYFLDADVNYAITKTGDPKQNVDLDDLGIDGDTTTPILELGWRFKQRWTLTGSYYGFDESGKLRNGRELVIDGTVFPVGIAQDSSVTVDTYILNLGYSFIKDKNRELGLGIGIHGFDFETDVKGYSVFGDNQVPIISENVNFVAPVPNLRVYGLYAFNSRWHATFKAGWLNADIDEYSGDFWLVDMKLEFRATGNLGVAAGYNWTRIDVEVEKSSKDEEYDLEFNGPVLYLSYSF
jgi:hypothetical protein